MGIVNGKTFLERISGLSTEIWLDGERVRDISNHPSFKGILQSKASLYDLQCDPILKEEMTFSSPLSSEAVGMSYLQPRTKEDLLKRRKMIMRWAQETAGMMGRSPDYLNTVIMSFATSASLLEGKENCYPNHIQSLYEMARERDLSFTHTFITPQVNRSSMYLEYSKEPIAAKIIEKNNKGLIIKGARLLATQGGLTDELLVFGAPKFDKDEAFAFSIPSDTKGVKFLCRESFVGGESTIDYPLSSRFEEMDSIVVFDHVLVPWERVFFYGDIQTANLFLAESSFNPFAYHQVITRQIVKTEFILGLAETMINTIDVGEYQHIQEKLAEIIIGLETMKALLEKAENDATVNEQGWMIPNSTPLQVASNIFPRIYPRFTEIIQLIGASGLVSLPTEKMFLSEVGKDLNQYLQAACKTADDRNKIFRLAWDLTMSSFGTRQTQYERFFFGDPIRLSGFLNNNYPKDRYVERINAFLAK